MANVMMNIPETVNPEIKYSNATKSMILGNPKINVMEIMPFTQNNSQFNGEVISFKLTSQNGFIDDARSEILYNITGVASATTLLKCDGASAPFRQIRVNALSGAELCNFNYYNKTNEVIKRVKTSSGSGHGNELVSPDTTYAPIFASSATSVATGFRSLEYDPFLNNHFCITDTQNSIPVSMPLRGLGVLSSAKNGVNGKYFPLCLTTGLQLDLQTETSANKVFIKLFGAGAFSTAPQLTNIRLRMTMVEYDNSLIDMLRQLVQTAGGLAMSSPRWYVQQLSLADNATAFNGNIGLSCSSLRSIVLFNSKSASTGLDTSYFSISPAFESTGNISNFFVNIDNRQYPNKPIDSSTLYDSTAEAVGGINNGVMDKIKYKSTIDTVLNVSSPAFGQSTTQCSPGLFIMGIDLESVATSDGHFSGMNTGTNQIQINFNTSAVSGARDLYVACLYDTITQILPDGSIRQVA